MQLDKAEIARIEREARMNKIRADFVPDPECPLITPYTIFEGIPDSIMRKLYALRMHDTTEDGPIKLKISDLVRDTTKLRGYQTQMVGYLMNMPRMIVGDAVGLGKTIDAIVAGCYHVQKQPTKIIIFATRSTTHQWEDEVHKFSKMKAQVCADSYGKLRGHAARIQHLRQFLASPDEHVFITKYTTWIGARKKLNSGWDADGNPTEDGKERVSKEMKDFIRTLQSYKGQLILICDEAQKFKSPGSQARSLIMYASRVATRVWAMTATPIKNSLEEFYSIMSAIGLRPLGTLAEFRAEFCVYRMQHFGAGRRKAQLKGYKRVKEFKAAIRPFYYGRSQAQVKEPLPKLSTHFQTLDLTQAQAQLLLEDIPSGVYQLPPSIKKVAGELFLKERDPSNLMTMLSVYQLVANNQCLLDPSDLKGMHNPALSPKEEALLDLLDGDFAGEKVIVYTKSRSWIDRFEYLYKHKHFGERKFLRITGNEDETERHVNKKLFQESEEHDLIFINNAAIEGVNLQQAAHIICLDLPWSWGDLLQLVGRMIRMASPHAACTLRVLVMKGTIDEYTIETLRTKKGVFEKILGESFSQGILDDGTEVLNTLSGMDEVSDDEAEFRDMLRAHVKSLSMGQFVRGTVLEKEINGKRRGNAATVSRGSRKHSEFATTEELDAIWAREQV